MPRSLAFLLVSGVVLGTSFALPQQQEKLAEEEFKNIQSFKGAKASEIIPAMQHMTAALKVDCEFCHVEDYARDTKEEKRVTRQMIAMQNEINEKHFGGKLEVTCATCHNGREHPVATTLGRVADNRPRRSEDVDPAKVLAAYDKAVGTGGAAAARGVRLEGAMIEKGKTTPAVLTTSDGRFLFTFGPNKQGFNGTDPWYTMNGVTQVFPKAYGQQFIADKAVYFGTPTLPKLNSPYGGTATLNGKAYNAVFGRPVGDAKTLVSLFFDQKTGLLSRADYTYSTIVGPISHSNEYGNYQKVGTVMVPMMVTNTAAEKTVVMKFAKAKVVRSPSAAMFAPPR